MPEERQIWNRKTIAKHWNRIPTVTFQRKYIVLLSVLSIIGFYTMMALVDAGLVLWMEEAFPWFAYTRDVTDFPLKDKFGHLFSSGGFALIMNFFFRGRRLRFQKLNCYLGTLVVAVIIITEEFSQILFPLRSFDLLDLTFDIIGIHLFGNLAYPYVSQKLKFSDNQQSSEI